jgi:hypothetical protein
MKFGIAVRYVKFSLQASSVKFGSVTALLYLRASATFCRSFPHLFIDLGEIPTLTEVFPCFFLSCKVNAKVKPANTGYGPHFS